MREAEPSRSSMMVAAARGEHRLAHASPWVLDDPFALILIGPEWREVQNIRCELMREPVRRAVTAAVVARSRFAEDRLVDGSFSQYVILGAGLDSFACRRPDLLNALTVFEVDHPATQAWKRERLAALALPDSHRRIFSPIDFETETLRDGLTAAGLDWTRPVLFSWLGVTMYLTMDAIEATLDTIRSCAPGSEVVLTYFVSEGHVDPIGREFVESMTTYLVGRGEPFQRYFSPSEAEATIKRSGLTVTDHPTRDAIVARYFADRPDGLVPASHERCICGQVPR